MFKKTIFALLIGMIGLAACEKTIEFNIDDRDTFHIEIGGDTNHISVKVDGDRITIKGDSIVNNNDNHLHNSPEVEVNGGNTTNTNGNGNNDGGSNDNTNGNNSNATNSNDNDTLLIKISLEDFHKAFMYERLKKESSTGRATFATSFPDTLRELGLCFFDATRLDSTTLAFPTRIPAHENNGVLYPSVRTQGKFGADEDRTKRIVALNIDRDEGWGEMVDLGISHENGIDYRKLTGDVYLSGFAAGQGNNPDYATGRTLLGTDGDFVYILHLKNATSKGAAQAFENLNVCPPPYAEIAGGSFSNGLKPSPIHFRISYQWLEQN